MYMNWSTKYKKSIDCDNPKGFSQKAHCDGRRKNENTKDFKEGEGEISGLEKRIQKIAKAAKQEDTARVPREKGQHRGSSSHSDLYTDENPKGTIHGLKFATVSDAEKSVSKIKSSGKTHAHKIQAAVAMEQRAKEMGKSAEAGVYRAFINKMKEKTKKMNEGSDIKEDILSNTKNKVANWLGKTKYFVKNNWEEFKSATDREKKETIVALHIFQQMIMGEEVSEAEKRFLKSQSKDVVKILFLVSFKFVPSPIPITPITIFLGKKVGINVLPSSQHIATNEDLRKWFGKGKWGGKGGGGWDRYNTKGERIGKCGGGEKGDAYAACLSSAAADKLGKKGRANFVNRKRAAQKAGGDAKKGGEKTDGNKPIRVRWDKSGKKNFNPPT